MVGAGFGSTIILWQLVMESDEKIMSSNTQCPVVPVECHVCRKSHAWNDRNAWYSSTCICIPFQNLLDDYPFIAL